MKWLLLNFADILQLSHVGFGTDFFWDARFDEALGGVINQVYVIQNIESRYEF